MNVKQIFLNIAQRSFCFAKRTLTKCVRTAAGCNGPSATESVRRATLSLSLSLLHRAPHPRDASTSMQHSGTGWSQPKFTMSTTDWEPGFESLQICGVQVDVVQHTHTVQGCQWPPKCKMQRKVCVCYSPRGDGWPLRLAGWRRRHASISPRI